jgi:hypothetical protein
MIPILKENGYHAFNPKAVEYFGPSILDDKKYLKNFGNSADKLLKYNEKL